MLPQVSVVTRLVHQKGIHLIKHAAWRTLERGGQFVLLGSAPDPRVQVGERAGLNVQLMLCAVLSVTRPSLLYMCGCRSVLLESAPDPKGS
jgi:hypothetical protein